MRRIGTWHHLLGKIHMSTSGGDFCTKSSHWGNNVVSHSQTHIIRCDDAFMAQNTTVIELDSESIQPICMIFNSSSTLASRYNWVCLCLVAVCHTAMLCTFSLLVSVLHSKMWMLSYIRRSHCFVFIYDCGKFVHDMRHGMRREHFSNIYLIVSILFVLTKVREYMYVLLVVFSVVWHVPTHVSRIMYALIRFRCFVC